jgi:putative flippase GtrA
VNPASLVRYFCVGGVAAAVDLAIFALLAKVAGLPYMAVAVFSFIVATAVNYALSIRHVFRSGASFSRRIEIGLTFLVSGIGLLVNQAALWILVEKVGFDILVAKIGATGIVFYWNYTARARFVFREQE